MKYLKYFLLALLLIAIIFIAKGLLTPSIQYESEVTVNKSAAEAWAVMSDESKLPQWLKGFKKTELVSGQANTIGAISKVYIEENGQEMVMEETIESIKENEFLAMRFTMDFMNMEYEIHFKEKDGKTHIKTKSTTEGNGLIAKSIVSFMPKAMKAQEDENLGNLKKLIEANTKNYFPEAVTEKADTMEGN